MNYEIALLQRRHLDEGIEVCCDDDDSTLTLPPCEDEEPCMDGRCPTCGSRLIDLLTTFVDRDPAAVSRRWAVGSFAINSVFAPADSDEQVDLAAIKSALTDISDCLNDGESSFLGWLGIFIDQWGGTGRKIGALSFLYSGDLLNQDYLAKKILFEKFGDEAQPLEPWQPFTLGLWCEELLYGYCYASRSKYAVEPVLDSLRLAELALNYRQHRITDRLVTHGLAVGGGEIVISPGSSWPVFLNTFEDPATTRALSMEPNPW
jgi:hypothetical protein